MNLEPPQALDDDVAFLDTTPRIGVFFLCLADKLLYIGKSCNIVYDLGVMGKSVPYDRVYYKPLSEGQLAAHYKALVCKYLPLYNDDAKRCLQTETINQ